MVFKLGGVSSDETVFAFVSSSETKFLTAVQRKSLHTQAFENSNYCFF